MNRNVANWSLLLPLLVLGMLAFTFWQSGGALTTAAAPDEEWLAEPLAQATATRTATPTRNPANAYADVQGNRPIHQEYIARGDGTDAQSIYCTNCVSANATPIYGAGTPIPVQGPVGIGTPFAGTNPILAGARGFDGNIYAPFIAAPGDSDSSGDAGLLANSRLQAYDSANNLYERVRIEPTQKALWSASQGYVRNGASTPEAVTGGRAFMTPVTTPVGVQNVTGVGVARLTPVALAHGDFTSLQLDANGSLRTVAGGYTLRSSSNPTLSVAASYVSGDYVGTSATPWSWTACRTSGGTGQLQSITVVDKASQSISGELWLFDRSVTVPNDSAAWTITDADAQFLLGVVPVSTYYASAANTVASVTGVGLTIGCNGSTSVFGAWVTRGSPTYASGDLTIILGSSAD
jgi:hypothetical protein